MNIFNNLDPEKLISSVKPRRILYDRYDKLFHRYRLKKEVWFEICEELNRNFSRLSLLQKVEYCEFERPREIQKRWKNLRTCFTRELCLQRREQSARDKNLQVKKRKRYEYFEQLLFLRDCVESTEDTDHDNEKNNDREKDNESTNSSDALFIENVPVEYMESKSVDVKSDILISRNNTEMESEKAHIYEKSVNINERLLDIFKNTYKEDDDRHFALSLLPMFKELNTTRKLEARTDILEVLQNHTIRDD